MLKPFAFVLGLACAASTGAFDLEGHRGTRGLAPENTLPAFGRAMSIGVDTLELDVAMTADGVLVVSHDPFLNPIHTRDAAGQWLEGKRGPLIRSLTLAQLQAYDVGRIRPDTSYAKTFPSQQPQDGARVPTLKQVFELARSRRALVRFNIETKVYPDHPEDSDPPEVVTKALLAAVREAGLQDRVTVQSFDWRTLQLAQKLEPAIPTAYLTVQTRNSDNTRDPAWTAGLKLEDYGSVPKMVKAAGGAIWSPNSGALTEPLVREAQSLGLKVLPWTVNEPAEMDRLLAWGVDGIISDYPDRLREAMARRGMTLPAPAP
ncbi:glycerophosphodiester phosphodiesterase [Ramlibacter sp. G-1-2-2]|uniref:Glycerophosphodiester phosphodiesterase n=1 Tax=Ramlibacter agri TaxID=2728837 RepID=A0A848H276_9BURK|nr:glycerophosphodiester phosphodiesterase [Ramlibacter agri]NML44925.1 glycerophosphodiester phosphodiesterase [Ramlibacter agri]